VTPTNIRPQRRVWTLAHRDLLKRPTHHGYPTLSLSKKSLIDSHLSGFCAFGLSVARETQASKFSPSSSHYLRILAQPHHRYPRSNHTTAFENSFQSSPVAVDNQHRPCHCAYPPIDRITQGALIACPRSLGPTANFCLEDCRLFI